MQITATSADGFPSKLTASAGGSGDAGKLTINTKKLVVRDGVKINVNSQISKLTKLRSRRANRFLRGFQAYDEKSRSHLALQQYQKTNPQLPDTNLLSSWWNIIFQT